MQRRWTWRAAQAAVTVAMGLAFAACPAGQNILSYCGLNVPPKTACADVPARHTYDTNQAANDSHFRKCEKMYTWDDEDAIWSRRCASGTLVVGHWCDYFSCVDANPRWNPDYLLRVKVGNDDSYYDQFIGGKAWY